MDYVQDFIKTIFLLKMTKPDVFYLIVFVIGYFLFFLVLNTLKKLFKKKQQSTPYQKKDLSAKQNRPKEKSKARMKNTKGHKDDSVNFLEYVLGAKDVMNFIWIRRKINKDNKISIPLHQAVYLMRHYPEYFYYAGEKQKILFEKINKKIFEPVSKKHFEVEDKTIDDEIKKIEFGNGSKVLIDHDGIIQDFVSAEQENKKIAENILSDFEEQNKAEEAKEDKEVDLHSKMRDFFGETAPEKIIQKQIMPQENSAQKQESSAQKDTQEISSSSEKEERPLSKKELKEKMRKEKKEKLALSEEEMGDIVDSLLKGESITPKTKPQEQEQKMQEIKEPPKESIEEPEEKPEVLEEKTEVVENLPVTQEVSEQKQEQEEPKQTQEKIKEPDTPSEKMIFELDTPVLNFLKEKAQKQDFGESVFLIGDKLVFYKDFFMKFLKGQEDSGDQAVLLKNLIRKFELSFDLEVLANQVISGEYKNQKIEGKFYVIALSQQERKSIEQIIF